MIALPFSCQRRPWFLTALRLFEPGDGFEESVLRVELGRKKAGAQAFAASFNPAVSLGLALEAIASLVFAVGGLRAQVSGFQRGRTRASQLLSSAMSQRANQVLETTTTAVTDRAGARSAPSAAVSHL
jgi:hypothetical protein